MMNTIDEETRALRLYVAGQTPKSVAAPTNLSRYCEQHLKGRYKLEVIDLLVHPQLAEGNQILAIPGLVRRLVGDLSDRERVLKALGISAAVHNGISYE
ncbi:circadian clock KaiB family protein [Hymenobacter antarcticus]|uniref:KaiB domain-containing protein n=1 Tax=Hymenobacter antarcticus TaxID=486270 RepID=A0ABP7PQ44_9BACT